MALDILKEYLVKVGFKVDDKSFKKTEKVIDSVGSQAGKALKKIPLDKVFGKKTADSIKQVGEHLNGFVDVVKQASTMMGEAGAAAEGAEAATAAFGLTALGTTAIVTAFVVALGGVVAGINAYIQSVAQADLKTEYFARRMMMTKENALSLQETMKVMGVNNVNDLIDVLNNPKGRAAYLENRKLANDMAGQLKGHEKGLEAFQQLNFEFQRMQMTADFAFKMAGARLAENLIEPIQWLTKLLKWINNFVSHNLLDTIDTVIKAVAPLGMGNIASARDSWSSLQSGESNKALVSINQKILDVLQWFKGAWDKFWAILLRLPGVKETMNAGKAFKNFFQQAGAGIGNLLAPPAQAAMGGGGLQGAIQAINERFPGQFIVTSTTGGRHAKNSLHYQGRAMDIVPKSGSNADYARLAQFLSSMQGVSRVGAEGFGVRTNDFIGGLSGIRKGFVQNFGTNANTTGKHFHVEFKNTFNIKGSNGKEIANDVTRNLAYQMRQHRASI